MVLQQKRKAFSMITAIVVIVLMASVAVFIMNLSGKMVKETTTQYQREQAILLSQSYTEYAVMAVTANEHNNSKCLNSINGSYQDYNITVDISYIGKGLDSSCNSISGRGRILANDVNTTNSPLNVIIDVFVRYPDYDHPGDLNMTYYKRTLQKI